MGRKSSIDEKLTPDELEAFYDQSSQRTSAIVLAAIVENHLTLALQLLMRQESALIKEQFSPSGPLGPFGNKIKFAYLMRLIDRNIYRDLDLPPFFLPVIA